jgi:hypothetical protein
MTTSTLEKKLTKLGIPFNIVDYNGFNFDYAFSIHGMNFRAAFNADSDIITNFCRNMCWNDSEQEMDRRWFDTFSKLIKYADANKCEYLLG